MPPFQVKSETLEDGQTLVFRCRGDLDAHTFEILDEELQDSFDEGASRIIVDLSQVPYMSSAGIGVLVGANNLAEENGGKMVLVKPSENVAQVLSDMGFDSLFTIAESVEEGQRKINGEDGAGGQRSAARRKSFD
jgi:anti-anti-sigma factor